MRVLTCVLLVLGLAACAGGQGDEAADSETGAAMSASDTTHMVPDTTMMGTDSAAMGDTSMARDTAM